MVPCTHQHSSHNILQGQWHLGQDSPSHLLSECTDSNFWRAFSYMILKEIKQFKLCIPVQDWKNEFLCYLSCGEVDETGALSFLRQLEQQMSFRSSKLVRNMQIISEQFSEVRQEKHFPQNTMPLYPQEQLGIWVSPASKPTGTPPCNSQLNFNFFLLKKPSELFGRYKRLCITITQGTQETGALCTINFTLAPNFNLSQIIIKKLNKNVLTVYIVLECSPVISIDSKRFASVSSEFNMDYFTFVESSLTWELWNGA